MSKEKLKSVQNKSVAQLPIETNLQLPLHYFHHMSYSLSSVKKVAQKI